LRATTVAVAAAAVVVVVQPDATELAEERV
jgi:hypothetical protein